MDFKRLVIGSLVGLVVLQLLGWLIFGVLFAGFFEANSGSATGVDREQFLLWALIVGDLCYALLIALAIETRPAAGIADGLKVGAVVGLLLWGTADFTLFGLTNVGTLAGTVGDALLEMVRGGVTGAVIAFVLAQVTQRWPRAASPA